MIMEKDVLLEMVATAIAFIHTRMIDGKHPKLDEMSEIEMYLLNTPYQQIDFKANIEKIKPIIDELEGLPYILGRD